jgi:hypothetical protein
MKVHWAEVQLSLESANKYCYFMLCSVWSKLCVNVDCRAIYELSM